MKIIKETSNMEKWKLISKNENLKISRKMRINKNKCDKKLSYSMVFKGSLTSTNETQDK